MKHRILVFLFALTTLARADFTEGVAAHAQGNFERALQVLLPLAQSSNDPYAQYYLGIIYANGQGVEKDPGAAGQAASTLACRLGYIFIIRKNSVH